MSGITRGLHTASIALSTLLITAAVLADDTGPDRRLPIDDSVKRDTQANGDEPPVLSQKEIDELLAEIRSRGKGNIMVVDCDGTYGYSSIQSAIDAAVDSDTVVVLPFHCDGRDCYHERINFLGKAITVQSAQPGNPAVVGATIINGDFPVVASTSIVRFVSGEGPESVLDGLTITEATWGAGVYCIGSSPTVRRCVIARNTAELGGGVYCQGASPTFVACVIEQNTVQQLSGAVLGAGVYCRSQSQPTFLNCIIRENTTLGQGGGICIDDSSTPAFLNCVICNNYAVYGGGLYSERAAPTLVNCLLYGNTATKGSTAYLQSSNAVFTNCTMVDNDAAGPAAGLHCADGGTSILTNCILRNGSAVEIFVENESAPIVSYCNVQGGWDGQGNIDADPMFAFADDYRLSPGSPCIDAGTNIPVGGLPEEDADGNPRVIDGDGHGPAVVDMGAYEFDPATTQIGVSPTSIAMSMLVGASEAAVQEVSIRNIGGGTLHWRLDSPADWLRIEPTEGESSGEVDMVELSVQPGQAAGVHSTWLFVYDVSTGATRTLEVRLYVARELHVPSEYATIQAAIDATEVPGDEVVVADGTYTGSGNKNIDFKGKAITVRSASGDPALCVIDCKGSGRGFVFEHGETSESRVHAMSVVNGLASYGGAVYCGAFSNPTLSQCHLVDSASSPEGAGYGAALYCTEASRPTLNECTVRNCAASYGGGIACRNASAPTLIDCVIAGNSASEQGGGLYCSGSSAPSFTRCTFTENDAEYGAAAYITSGSAAFAECVISANRATRAGSAIYSQDSVIDWARCTISDNDSLLSGGTIRVYGGAAQIRDSAIIANTSSGEAGIYCEDSELTLLRCSIRDNTSKNSSAGVSCVDSIVDVSDTLIADNSSGYAGTALMFANASQATVINCAITGNSARFHGGGVSCSGGSVVDLVHCTLMHNRSLTAGGGLHSTEAAISLANCILWNNEPQEIFVEYGDAPVITYSDIAGGWDGEGNIDANPRFMIAGDFHLAPDSPCIDAGTNAPPGGLPEHDIDGNERCVDGNGDSAAIADMGAHEFNSGVPLIVASPTFFEFVTQTGDTAEPRALVIGNTGGTVLQWSMAWDAAWLLAETTQGALLPGETTECGLTADAAGLEPGLYTAILRVAALPGSTPAREIEIILHVGSAFRVPADYATIQEAIDAAAGLGDAVILADGVYTGIGNKELDFAGKPITVRSESGDPTLCVIDCEGSGRGFDLHTYETSRSHIDRLTIQNGNSTYGGGIRCYYADPTITDCFVRDCIATGGGGIYCSSSSPTIVDCTVAHNQASGAGGGISSGGTNTELLLRRCTISDNASPSGAGVNCSYGCTLVMDRCIIDKNIATGLGGGVYWNSSFSGICRLMGCTIAGNHGGDYGGGLLLRGRYCTVIDSVVCGNTSKAGAGAYCVQAQTAVFTNCTFYENTATLLSGAIGGTGYVQFLIDNCVLWEDSPDEVTPLSSALYRLSHCDIRGGWTGDGDGNIDVDPLFVDPLGPDGLPGTADDDLRLSALSPCIDAGDSSDVDSSDGVDLDGRDRVRGCGVDIGAYEFVAGAPGSGDLDGNSVVNEEDVFMFVQGLLDVSNLAACVADVNGDDRIDGRDIQRYAEMMLAR